MQAKIKRLMESEGLSTSRFAELLAIQPSGVSHIVSGRNKPSFELLQRILRRFPQVNPDWLLLDSEQVYRSEPGVSTTHLTAKSRGETPTASMFDIFVEPNQEKSTPQTVEQLATTTASEVKSQDEIASIPQKMAATSRGRANIERVVIFYDDGTFASYDTKK